MKIEDSLAIGAALGDRSRLLLLGILRTGPRCTEELAAHLALAPSTVPFHLKRLKAAGLVTMRREQYCSVYELRSDLRSVTLDDLIPRESRPAEVPALSARNEHDEILLTWCPAGRLAKIPVQRRKRGIVMEPFVCLFEPGVEYTEGEVDWVASTLTDDPGGIRRLLVEEGYFRRRAGMYLRTNKQRGHRSD